MKQKVVIKVSMNNSKCRAKALKIAVSVPGVISAELQGPDKDQLAIIGEGMDATHLTVSIRKKFCYAEIVSVTPVDEKKKEEEKKKVEEEKKIEEVRNPIFYTPYQYPQYQYGTPPIYSYEVRHAIHDPICCWSWEFS